MYWWFGSIGSCANTHNCLRPTLGTGLLEYEIKIHGPSGLTGLLDHVVLKLSIRSSALPRVAAVWLGFWNSESEYVTFGGDGDGDGDRDGTGRDGQTDKQTDKQTNIGTDRLFSENIILDFPVGILWYPTATIFLFSWLLPLQAWKMKTLLRHLHLKVETVWSLQNLLPIPQSYKFKLKSRYFWHLLFSTKNNIYVS